MNAIAPTEPLKLRAPITPCSRCNDVIWWRFSVLSGGPSPWHCEWCRPPPTNVWLDGSAGWEAQP